MFFELVKNKLIYETDKIKKSYNRRCAEKNQAWETVATIDETIDRLLNTECSMCRYGDGEFKVMNGSHNGFQKADNLLASRLKEILQSRDDNIIVCIPNIKDDMLIRTPSAKRFWESFIDEYGKKFCNLLINKKKYYDAHVTRLYMDYQKIDLSEAWYDKIKMVWANKDLLIIEGENTRLGTGNDLFKNASSIKRIICPGKSAFSQYENIVKTVKKNWNGELVLIALGQTATVLAYDLAKSGIRALDIGHIDIEYEWFLQKATKKVAIFGKFVKEVDEQLELDRISETRYSSQIIARVENNK